MTVLPFDLPGYDTPAEPPAPVGAHPAPVRVYESPLATVWHGRCEDVLRTMPTESVDLIVTDPPYGIEHTSRRRADSFGQIDGDGADAASRAEVAAVLTETVRLVGQQRHLYVFGPTDVLDGLKVSDVVPLYWDKGTMGGGDVTAAWGPQIEPINFTVSKHRHAGKAGKETIPTRLRKGNLLSYTRPTGRNVKRHPHEKPVPLLRELIESSSRQGELVLDPYAGSGSTGVAAILTGRRVILCESREQWAKIAAERVRAAESIMDRANGI